MGHLKYLNASNKILVKYLTLCYVGLTLFLKQKQCANAYLVGLELGIVL